MASGTTTVEKSAPQRALFAAEKRANRAFLSGALPNAAAALAKAVKYRFGRRGIGHAERRQNSRNDRGDWYNRLHDLLLFCSSRAKRIEFH
jgi:hypothetical protein